MAETTNFPYSGYGPPAYSEKEIQALRINQVHFLAEHFLFLLSDGRVLCVPLSIRPDLESAPQEQRYQWQLIGEGRAVVWHTDTLQEHVSLRALLEQPEARVGNLPDGSPLPSLR
jgi:hypothetical protein